MSITDSERLSISELAALAAPNNKKEALTAYVGYFERGQVASVKEVQLPVLGVHSFRQRDPLSGCMSEPKPLQHDASWSLLDSRGRLKTATKPKTHSFAPVQYITRSEACKIALLEHAAGRWSPDAWAWCGGQREYLTAKAINKLPEFEGKTYKQRGTTKKPKSVESLLSKWQANGLPEDISNPDGQGFDVAILRLQLATHFEEVTPSESQPSRIYRAK